MKKSKKIAGTHAPRHRHAHIPKRTHANIRPPFYNLCVCFLTCVFRGLQKFQKFKKKFKKFKKIKPSKKNGGILVFSLNFY